MTEGLFTSEMGIRGGDRDVPVIASRTLSLSDFQRRNIYGQYEKVPRHHPRGNGGIYLRPRAPDATVTASVVEINVNDGTSTSKLTEVTAGTSATVVAVSAGASASASVTLAGVSGTGSTAESSQQTITTGSESTSSSPTLSHTTDGSAITTTTASSSAVPIISESFANSTTSIRETSSTLAQNTVTITATSTYEVSLQNGTIFVPESTVAESTTNSAFTSVFTTTGSNGLIITETTSEGGITTTSPTFTFGELTSTPSVYSRTSQTSGASATSTSDSSAGSADPAAAGSTTVSSGPAATSTSDSGSSGSGGGSSAGLTPTQQQVVGGVVGGVAGIAILLLIVLVILRWYRRRLKARGQLPEQIAARELTTGSNPSYAMSQRSSNVPFAAVFANSLKRLRPHSLQTTETTATGGTDPSIRESERGFRRIAGRKIAPVLGNNGDPYGGNYGAFEKDTIASPSDPLRNADRGLAGSTFYRDSAGFYGGPGSHSPTFPSSPTTATRGTMGEYGATPSAPGSSARDFADAQNSSQVSLTSPTRPEGYAVMRPSPARTPVTLSPAPSFIRLPIQQAPALDEDAPPLPTGLLVPGQRDGVGRSLSSHDGSHVSRSSARSGGRFVENM
ncbi:hypothetical protein LTR10_019189 [Elasticomyces elasticus]|uniref:Uncharacterized protein n=1 Tax=Exophiala sideris TaxID=1016849 RepID=A0ABR0J881_9EURO|nr:hypothetical protein LTR10_019189 [Elasticomyces elasticus]KAK5025509.1 hypothetical protein LTR13_010473 [Exophiala sideris]KAK5029782.1 hypothetical protein LTS07_005506 [Exophiala sideris]KAK5058456.1 hypothetical protein LTR69_006861 [Exophiala sideris]KAK5178571.1 hypothetical protein LTR44_008942 [Eurotiomycetes sp. CCFEE 6388]